MADGVSEREGIGGASSPPGAPTHSRAAKRHEESSFHAVLVHLHPVRPGEGRVAHGERTHALRHDTVHATADHASARHASPALAPISEPVRQALRQAMSREEVPGSWQPALELLIARESSGRVGVHNPRSSARGLFQLTGTNYHLNPRGVRSFGNAVEEAQGGIRYFRAHYGSADAAVAHWQLHRVY